MYMYYMYGHGNAWDQYGVAARRLGTAWSRKGIDLNDREGCSELEVIDIVSAY